MLKNLTPLEMEAFLKLKELAKKLTLENVSEDEFRTQINTAMDKSGLGKYVYIGGRLNEPFLRLKRPNPRMPKRRRKWNRT